MISHIGQHKVHFFVPAKKITIRIIRTYVMHACLMIFYIIIIIYVNWLDDPWDGRLDKSHGLVCTSCVALRIFFRIPIWLTPIWKYTIHNINRQYSVIYHTLIIHHSVELLHVFPSWMANVYDQNNFIYLLFARLDVGTLTLWPNMASLTSSTSARYTAISINVVGKRR